MSDHKELHATDAPLDDEQLMSLMAFADGELAEDESASADVRALLERSADARVLVNDLQLARRALHEEVFIPTSAEEALPELDVLKERVLADVAAMQLMAHADGEAIGEAAELDGLLAESSEASALLHDLNLSKQALRAEVQSDQTEADVSMVRGRIMSKLPAQTRPPVAAEDRSEGLGERLRALLFGRPGLAFGLAAAAVLMVLALGQMKDRAIDDVASPEIGPVAEKIDTPLPDDEPAVIIEEMEIDSGTVLVDNGAEPGAATIIWHYSDDDGEGAG